MLGDVKFTRRNTVISAPRTAPVLTSWSGDVEDEGGGVFFGRAPARMDGRVVDGRGEGVSMLFFILCGWMKGGDVTATVVLLWWLQNHHT